MARFNVDKVNPDLAAERQKATFNPEQITCILDGAEYLTEKRRFMESMLLNDRTLSDGPDFNFLSRSEKYSEAVKKAGYYLKILKEKSINNRADSYFLSNLLFPNETSPIGLHGAMFVPTLESQCSTEQKEKWLNKAYNHEILGTYAQTELGHGTNVRGLETTSTYDPKTEEFVLHSPTLTSTKWWPGGLGKTCNYAIVMALLYTKGECQGIHGFIVQLRDLNTHTPLPGIILGDIGPKFGFGTIDNGFLRFDHVRIPRENMLMKNSQVSKDGSYIRPKSEKLAYGSMIFIRAMVVLDQAARGLAQACTIAVRYSCVRRQSEFKPGEREPQVMDYQTQQYKLLPQLASAYAFYFAGLKMRETYFTLNYEIQQGNTECLPELHAASSGLKALSTEGAMFGIEQCRLACGGHGYSDASGIPKIYTQVTAACTYEGENTVLYLQTARYLVKAFQQRNSKISSSLGYLTEEITGKYVLSQPITLSSLVEAYKHRARRLIVTTCQKLKQLEAEGRAAHDAWNIMSVSLTKAAQAHCHLYIIETFVDKLSSVTEVEVYAVLLQLFELYAIHGITSNAGDFIEDGYMNTDQLNMLRGYLFDLLTIIRPNAVALVDSFDFTDHLLGSILGRYDGNVYEHLYKWALSSPLNKSQVHESIKYLKPFLQPSKL